MRSFHSLAVLLLAVAGFPGLAFAADPAPEVSAARDIRVLAPGESPPNGS